MSTDMRQMRMGNMTANRAMQYDFAERAKRCDYWPALDIRIDRTIPLRTVLQSLRFRAVVSRGPVARYHLLIIEKNFSGHRGFAELQNSSAISELDQITREASQLIEQASGSPNWIAFEHGVFDGVDRTACGTAVAHRHVVSCTKQTLKQVAVQCAEWPAGSSLEWLSMQAPYAQEYVWVHTPMWSRCSVISSGRCQSQFLRRLIRESEFGDSQWDWRRGNDGAEVGEMLVALLKVNAQSQSISMGLPCIATP